MHMPFQAYLPKSSFTYLLNSQNGTLNATRVGKTAAKKQLIANASSCLRSVCYHRRPARDNVHIGLQISSFGMHQDPLEGLY